MTEVEAFRAKSITVGRGSSRQRGESWEKIYIELNVELLDDKALVRCKKAIDELFSAWISEWQNEDVPIYWKQMSGEKGRYELAQARANQHSAEFQSLKEKLESLGGSMTEGNYYYWLFPDHINIGRKRRD